MMLLALWVRSYRRGFHFSVCDHWVVSSYGKIFVDIYFPAEAERSRDLEVGFCVSYWVPFAITLCSALGTMPWNVLSKRFSLRTLLIATTAVAVILGVVVGYR
jgi:hypothetical protein